MLTIITAPLCSLLIIGLAFGWDTLLGEPPARYHPVVWMGKLVGFWKRYAPRPQADHNLQLLYGLVAVMLCSLAILVGSIWFFNLLLAIHEWLAVAVSVYLLKGCFSVRMLGSEGLKIRRLLEAGDLEQARFEMRSLVSRDTSQLTADEICGAAIESVAENTTDSVIAPLFYFMLAGIPGVLFYRLVNTFDSMIGYRGRWEFAGKSAARLDDVLNWLPARLTAYLIAWSAPLYEGNRKNALYIMKRDKGNTKSPNAGWTMAAIAGALEIRLTKRQHYALGDDLRPIYPALILATVKALYLVTLEFILLFGLLVAARLFFS